MRPPAWWWRTPPAPAARLLQPLAAVYGWVAAARLRRRPPMGAPVPVICVGNLVVGGAGKTPTALGLAERLIGAGLAVHFATRGYGGRLAGPVRVDPARHRFQDVGDEALLLAGLAPVWVARDRAAGVRAAAEGADVVVMDDGFQNPLVRPDVALLVIDPRQGFGNGLVLPAGPLRESARAALARADCVVMVGPGDPDAAVSAAIAGAGVRVIDAVLTTRIPTALTGRPLLAFAGIGRPEKFFDGLRAAGASVRATRAFPDHHPFHDGELQDLLAEAGRLGAALVTTAKDRVRLPPWASQRIAVADAHLRWADPAACDAVLAGVVARARARLAS